MYFDKVSDIKSRSISKMANGKATEGIIFRTH